VFLDGEQRVRASGYVLSQGTLIEDITESFVFGDYRTYQVPITRIAEATGLDFKGLERADVLEQAPLPEAVPGRPRVIALDRLEDMLL
jgi:endonuclease G